MRLFDLIFSQIGEKELSGDPNYTVTPNSAYFQNVKEVLELSSCKIILKMKDACLCVIGEKMFLLKIYGGDVAIGGKVTEIKRYV